MPAKSRENPDPPTNSRENRSPPTNSRENRSPPMKSRESPNPPMKSRESPNLPMKSREQGEPEPADEEQGEPEPADEEQGEPEPADEEQGEPEPADEEQGEPEPADEEQGELEPSDEEEDDADPSEDEETGTGEFLFEDSGKYVSVSITGSYPSEQKPAAHTAVIPDNEEYRVLEAWSVDGLSEDFSLKLTAQMIVLPELTEGESLSFVSLNGTTLGKELDKDMAAGDKLELELACESATGIALVKTVVKIEETEILYTDEDPLWANRDLYLTGKMPKNAVATAESVPIDIDGEEVLAAWDIKIYSAPDKVGTDEIWQPEDGAVQVHLRSDAFDGLEGTLNVYHMEDADGEAELVGTVETENEWISFDAESFSTYVVSIVLEKTITATDGKTYRITVAFDADSGIPSDAQLEVRELSGEEFDEYLGRTAVIRCEGVHRGAFRRAAGAGQREDGRKRCFFLGGKLLRLCDRGCPGSDPR